MRKIYDIETGETTVDETFVFVPDPVVREDSILPKSDFIDALEALQILPPLEAVAAERGEWPATFDGFLVGMTDAEKAENMKAWIRAVNISYSHPLLQALALTYVATVNPGNTQEQNEAARTALLDGMFGIA